MKYEAYSYQDYATEYIKNKPISALMLDMGLGKTIITLSALNDLLFDSFDVHKILIVAPLRVAKHQWPNELKKWDHLKELTYSLVVGTAKQRTEALMKKADIYIINRENLSWLVNKSFIRLNFDMIVIDELSSFKNSKTERFKALQRIRPKAKRIVGLTGTPTSNGLMDLWAEYRLLDCGKRLGRFISNYRDEYFMPDKRNGQTIYSYKLLPGADKRIYKKIDDITMSMEATDYLDMPGLIYRNHEVELSDETMDLYISIANDYIASLDGDDITAANAAVVSGKLMQIANGALYDDEGDVKYVHDEKLEALEDLIEASNGKPLLVAYWYNHDLKRIKKLLDNLNIVYDDLKNDDAIDKWNNKELQVGLIHPASAGHGLNLQDGGNTLVWFGLTWSLELYQQTNARLYRQGQKAKSVVVIHIIAKNTIDEQVLKVLEGKETRQKALIEAVKASIKGGGNNDF